MVMNRKGVAEALQRLERTCEDEVIGFLCKEEGSILFQRRKDYNFSFVPTDKHDSYCKAQKVNVRGRIALILESPHIDEVLVMPIDCFDKSMRFGMRPAYGATGLNITKYLHEVFYPVFLNLGDGCYSVSLLNAIQKQCSMGVNPKYFRDMNWIEHWIMGGQLNFQTRLSTFRPSVALNCCTVGKHFRFDGFKFESRVQEITPKFLKDECNLQQVKHEEGLAFLGEISLRGAVRWAVLNALADQDAFAYAESTHPSSWFMPKNRFSKSHLQEKSECYFYAKRL